MADILTLISDAERLDFSQNLSVARPAYLGDRLFPDQKTENLKAEYMRLANGATLPVMATVHAFDTCLLYTSAAGGWDTGSDIQ